MSKAKKLASDALSWLLCICLVIGWGGVSNLFLNTQQAHAYDVGVNPSPKVDIAVAVPSDYPGTFLDFKAELTEKLIAQGMDPSDFRITDTATKIDTTDQSNWVVYDHYYNEAQYNQLGYTAEQQKPILTVLPTTPRQRVALFRCQIFSREVGRSVHAAIS